MFKYIKINYRLNNMLINIINLYILNIKYKIMSQMNIMKDK